MYLTKSVGSSVFFVAFPLLVVISCDEKGQGLLLVREERKTQIDFHLFSLSMQLKDYVLDVITLRVMRQRVQPTGPKQANDITTDETKVEGTEKQQE